MSTIEASQQWKENENAVKLEILGTIKKEKENNYGLMDSISS